jgi:C4-dicarboxylate-specific signal transduction histidine kinase
VNPLAKYSLARLGLFVAVLAVLSLLGAGRITAVLGAAVISLLLSYVLLRGLRNAASQQIADRVQRRLDERAARREADSEPE